MSDISKLIVNGITYDIKDSVARASSGGGLNVVKITSKDFEASASYTLKNHSVKGSYNIFIVSGNSGSFSDFGYLDFAGLDLETCGCVLILPDTYDDSLGGGWITYNNNTNIATITATAKDTSKPFLLTWFFGSYTINTTAYY